MRHIIAAGNQMRFDRSNVLLAALERHTLRAQSRRGALNDGGDGRDNDGDVDDDDAANDIERLRALTSDVNGASASRSLVSRRPTRRARSVPVRVCVQQRELQLRQRQLHGGRPVGARPFCARRAVG